MRVSGCHAVCPPTSPASGERPGAHRWAVVPLPILAWPQLLLDAIQQPLGLLVAALRQAQLRKARQRLATERPLG